MTAVERVEKILKADMANEGHVKKIETVDERTARVTLDTDEHVKITVQLEDRPLQLFQITFGVFSHMLVGEKIPDELVKLNGKSLRDNSDDPAVIWFFNLIGGHSYDWREVANIVAKKFNLKALRMEKTEHFKKIVQFSLEK